MNTHGSPTAHISDSLFCSSILVSWLLISSDIGIPNKRKIFISYYSFKMGSHIGSHGLVWQGYGNFQKTVQMITFRKKRSQKGSLEEQKVWHQPSMNFHHWIYEKIARAPSSRKCSGNCNRNLAMRLFNILTVIYTIFQEFASCRLTSPSGPIRYSILNIF